MIPLVRLVLVSALLALPLATTAHAQADFATVAPVIASAALADIDMTGIGGPGRTITAAEEVTNAAGVTVWSVSGRLVPSIGFSILLPVETWKQRFFQIGCGGLCGSIGFNAAAPGCMPFETGAVALAASDMGHRGHDPSFGQDPQKRADFAWRGQPLTTLAAQHLIQAYYGRSAEFSYLYVYSERGREALMLGQRHKDVFDGIIARAPAANFEVQDGIYRSSLTRAKTAADGGAVLLAPRLPLLHAAVLAACDTIDGQADRLIAFRPACYSDPATLECPAVTTDTTACLTTAEVATVRALYDAINPDPWAFAGSGGKLILWHGLSDQHISPMNSLACWQAMASTLGAGAVADFARFCLFPGMYHCSGDGPNVIDLLTPILAWVEGGTAPEAVVAALPVPTTRNDHGGPGAEPPAIHADPDPEPAAEIVAMHPVVPYRYRAVWDGAGDPTLAESYGRLAGPAAWTVREWAGADLFSPTLPSTDRPDCAPPRYGVPGGGA